MEEAYVDFPGPIFHLHLQGQQKQIQKESKWGHQEENKLHYCNTHFYFYFFAVFAVTLKSNLNKKKYEEKGEPFQHQVQTFGGEEPWLGFSCQSQMGHRRVNGGNPVPLPAITQTKNHNKKIEKRG